MVKITIHHNVFAQSLSVSIKIAQLHVYHQILYLAEVGRGRWAHSAQRNSLGSGRLPGGGATRAGPVGQTGAGRQGHDMRMGEGQGISDGGFMDASLAGENCLASSAKAIFSAEGTGGRGGNKLEEVRPELDRKWSDPFRINCWGVRQREAGRGSTLP